MIDEKLLDEVKAVRASHPGMSYDEAWNIAASKRAAIPGDLGAATLAVQAETPGLSFEEAWDLVEAEALPFLRKNETVGMALIRARQQKPEPKPWDGLPTEDFDEWLAETIKRQKERPKHVEAIEEHVEAIEWQPGKRLLIRGSEAVFVD